jgi:hypothetical protein
LGTYQVRKWVNPGVLGAFSWRVQDHIQAPGLVENPSYHAGMAVFVYNPSTGNIPTYVVDYGGTNPPHVFARVNGTILISQPISGTNVGDQGGYRGIVAGDMTVGTYWVVAFGFGGDHGILDPPNTSTWSVVMNYGGVACSDPVSVPGQIVNYNNSHFTGGTHVYAPGAEVGKDINLSFDVAEKNVFGLIYNSTETTASFGTYRTPSCFNCGYSPGVIKLVSKNGHYSFTKTLVAGVDSSFDIDFLKLTLPPI